MRRISDNKFRNFLHRILKKKYKEVKEDDGNKSINFKKNPIKMFHT